MTVCTWSAQLPLAWASIPDMPLVTMQMTAFAARLALDCQRVQGGYTDCLPCIRLPPEKLQAQPSDSHLDHGATDAPGTETMNRQVDMALTQMPAGEAPRGASAAALDRHTQEAFQPDGADPPSNGAQPPSNGSEPSLVQSLTGRVRSVGQSFKGKTQRARGRLSRTAQGKHSGAYGVTPGLHWYMEYVHAPALAKPVVQLGVLAVFVGLFVASLASLPHVSR